MKQNIQLVKQISKTENIRSVTPGARARSKVRSVQYRWGSNLFERTCTFAAPVTKITHVIN